MKTCDEMMNSLFERRAQYVIAQRKKKKVMAGATATLCAVSLLGGGVWYLNRPTHDIPVVDSVDNIQTTTTTEAPKLLITGDEPDDYDKDNEGFGSMGTMKKDPISPLLKEKMEQYRDINVVYAVIAQGGLPDTDYNGGFFETNEEMIRLSEAFYKAYDEYVNAVPEDPSEKYSTVPAPEKLAKYYAARDEYLKSHYELYGNVDEITDEAVRSREQKDMAFLAYYDARVEWRTCISTGNPTWEEIYPYVQVMNEKHEAAKALSRVWENLLNEAREEYWASMRKQQFDALAAQCEKPPVEFSSGYVHGYYVELTAEQINTLVECGYTFRLAMPNGVDEFSTSDWESF